MSVFALPQQLDAVSRDVTRFYYEIDEADTVIDSQNGRKKTTHMFTITKDNNRFWLPAKSYFRFEISLLRMGLFNQNEDTSNRPLLIGDRVGPIRNFTTALFKEMRFYIGPDLVNKVGEHGALIQTISDRITKSKSWLETVGKSLGKQRDLKERQKMFVPPQVRLNQDLGFKTGYVDGKDHQCSFQMELTPPTNPGDLLQTKFDIGVGSALLGTGAEITALLADAYGNDRTEMNLTVAPDIGTDPKDLRVSITLEAKIANQGAGGGAADIDEAGVAARLTAQYNSLFGKAPTTAFDGTYPETDKKILCVKTAQNIGINVRTFGNAVKVDGADANNNTVFSISFSARLFPWAASAVDFTQLVRARAVNGA